MVDDEAGPIPIFVDVEAESTLRSESSEGSGSEDTCSEDDDESSKRDNIQEVVGKVR